MTGAMWLTFAVIGALQALVLKALVKVMASKAENAWDNAFAYVAVSGVLLYFPVRWMVSADGWSLTVLAFALLWVGQTAALRVLYEIETLRAWLIGVVHAAVSSVIVTASSLVAGVIAAYILYGKIISDPMRLIRIIFELIGLPLPV